MVESLRKNNSKSPKSRSKSPNSRSKSPKTQKQTQTQGSEFKVFKNHAKQIYTTGKLNDKDKSYDKCQENEEAKAMENPVSLTELLEGKRDTKYEFNTICKAVKTKEMITSYQDQDIYCDVHPFEATSIWLGEEQNKENYINACSIQSPY